MSTSQRIPVTIVTGFLGSGKTTLLRYLLKNGNRKLAVIVNEFGSIGLDGDLFKSCGFCEEKDLNDRVVELNNGCLCCTVQDDFLPAIQSLLLGSKEIDGIVIETSGLALPKPLLQALAWPEIRSKVFVNGVVTLVDGESFSNGNPIGNIQGIDQQRKEDRSIEHLTPLDELFSHQLEVADLVLITRLDKISTDSIEKIQTDISIKVRSSTPIVPISQGEIDPSIVLGIQSDIEHSQITRIPHKNDEEHSHLMVHTTSFRYECSVEQTQLQRILTHLASKFEIIRLKGRCWLSDKSLPLQIQMVGARLDSWFEKVPETSWKAKDGGVDFVIISFKHCSEKEILRTFKEFDL